MDMGVLRGGINNACRQNRMRKVDIKVGGGESDKQEGNSYGTGSKSRRIHGSVHR
jgi:hypothetical protein